MTLDDNHNHFCIYCGAKLIPNQHFCSQCGKKVYKDTTVSIASSKYGDEINKINKDYTSKQYKASNLVAKLFTPTDMAYDKFNKAINKSNQIFNNQLSVVQKMIELDLEENELIDMEIENKIKTLYAFVNKMDELINELVIHLSSNKKDDDDVNNLFSDMDDLIDSVKNY